MKGKTKQSKNLHHECDEEVEKKKKKYGIWR
jgi:hypothetical protein